MKELAISIRNYNKDNYIDVIKCIKKAGFKNVFIEWYNYDLELQENILNCARDNGLNVIFAHLGYQNSNAIWLDCEDGEKELKRYMNDIDVCHKNGINLVIIHPTRKYENPGVTEIGIERVRKLVEYASQRGVKIAFENVELKGHLEAIVDNISSNMVGICFDAGHCNLFYDGDFDVDKFRDRVLTIHLHDNFKEKDDHNLPFDGTVDWDKVIKQIVDMNYDDYIVIESGYNGYYSNISLEDYYKLAFERGVKLEKLFDLYKNKKQ